MTLLLRLLRWRWLPVVYLAGGTVAFLGLLVLLIPSRVGSSLPTPPLPPDGTFNQALTQTQGNLGSDSELQPPPRPSRPIQRQPMRPLRSAPPPRFEPPAPDPPPPAEVPPPAPVAPPPPPPEPEPAAQAPEAEAEPEPAPAAEGESEEAEASDEAAEEAGQPEPPRQMLSRPQRFLRNLPERPSLEQ